MKFDLDLATAVLERKPAVLDALLRDQPREWTHRDEGPDTFSPFDVVGHLIHGERTDWIPRARIILEHGEARAFDPFDRFAMRTDLGDRTMNELLDTFAAERTRTLRELAGLGLTEADLARRGLHPRLGPVTLGQLLATWVIHDLGHLRQVTRVMAKQWRDEIGPWREYSPIVRE
jgi:hypothetical protein